MRVESFVAAAVIVVALLTIPVSQAFAQQGPGGLINPQRDCQTVLQCRFRAWRRLSRMHLSLQLPPLPHGPVEMHDRGAPQSDLPQGALHLGLIAPAGHTVTRLARRRPGSPVSIVPQALRFGQKWTPVTSTGATPDYVASDGDNNSTGVFNRVAKCSDPTNEPVRRSIAHGSTHWLTAQL